MRIVKIEWLDICSGTHNWTSIEDLDLSPLKCVSVGMLVKETDQYICIAQNYVEGEGSVSDTTTFPKSVVVKMTDLS